MKAKEQKKIELKAWKSLPNEAHRAEKWSGVKVVRNRKKYSRKTKHKAV